MIQCKHFAFIYKELICPCYQDLYWHIMNNCHEESGPGKAAASRNVNHQTSHIFPALQIRLNSPNLM